MVDLLNIDYLYVGIRKDRSMQRAIRWIVSILFLLPIILFVGILLMADHADELRDLIRARRIEEFNSISRTIC